VDKGVGNAEYEENVVKRLILQKRTKEAKGMSGGVGVGPGTL
jgi:hypothetical protein